MKWSNWNSFKGMDPQVAKIKWLEMIEPLILKKGLPKCKW
jgi:acyl-CoA-binding protein